MAVRITIVVDGGNVEFTNDAIPAAPWCEVGRSEQAIRLLAFLSEHAAFPPRFFSAASIGSAVGCSGGDAGRLLQDMVPVRPVPRKGYPSREIYQYLEGAGWQDLVCAAVKQPGTNGTRADVAKPTVTDDAVSRQGVTHVQAGEPFEHHKDREAQGGTPPSQL